MRSSKSILAGLAAGALVVGLVPLAVVATATSASAATATATVSPVRATGTTSPLSIPAAVAGWRGTGAMASSTLDITTAPTATAKMTVGSNFATLNDDTTVSPQVADDTYIAFNVDTAGVYAGRIANGTDTVSFSFTTAGAPTSMSITPATQTVLVGSVANFVISLKDAAGNLTQPQAVDNVTVTSSDDTVGTSAITGSMMSAGVFDDSLITGSSSGTTTITATPGGTLVASGVTAQTATVVKSGTVSNVAIAGISVSVPANAANAGTMPTKTAQVAEGTTLLTVAIDDTTAAAAGNALRFKAVLSAGGTLNGAPATAGAPQYINVTTDAAKKATVSFAVGGAGALNNSQLTLTQVNVLNANVTLASTAVTETVTWRTPVVQPSNIVPNPKGSLVAKVGTTTNISVQVDDSFGVDQAGWTVAAFRGSVSPSNLISTATTSASGVAAVTVSPASATAVGSETYVYTAQPPVGGGVVTSSNTTIVSYTASGNITTLSVTPSTGAAFTNASTSIATLPVILVPSSGTVATSTSAGVYTVSSATVTTAPTTSMATFTINTDPDNSTVVTVPEGVKVSATAPTSSTLWSAGSQTATIADAGAVYVWGTKTGIHEVTFTSGGVTTKGKIVVANAASDAYNISITPAAQDLAKGGFGTATVSLTDVFGNAVAGSGSSSPINTVTIVAAGEVLLGGFNATQNVTVGANGSGTVTIVAGNTAGAGTLTVTPAATATGVAAWVAGYTPPTGATAPKVSAVATVAVGTGPVTKTITITGSRTTVSGKPGIEIDGVVSGIEDGKTVIPYFRFPGETSYTQGSARPVITDSSFVWQRKTGKKFYAYVTNDDGSTTSNRVIIPAN
jgi:hypothetical protein